MADPTSVKDQGLLTKDYDFSLVLGGPFYQMLRRSRLADDVLDLVRRRILIISAFTWLPLLIFSFLDGHAWTGVPVPFLYDLDAHLRFLVALPLLIYSELVVHRRMRRVVQQFLERGLIDDSQKERFFAIVQSADRLRNTPIAEIVMVLFIYGVGIPLIWQNMAAVHGDTWYARTGQTDRPLAGLWYVYVSLPVFQFIIYRWYFRLIVWTTFLWKVSRLNLRLIPTHPDLSGGLGFLANTVYAFATLLLAHGVLFSGSIANAIFYGGAKLPQYQLEIFALVLAALFIVLGPLLVFVGPLSAARRKGLAEYGALAHRYVKEFDQKWLRGGVPEGEAFIGSADIQSLADLSNSFDVIRSMNIVPFTRQTIFNLAVVTLIPLTPLLLTMISLEELINRFVSSVL